MAGVDFYRLLKIPVDRVCLVIGGGWSISGGEAAGGWKGIVGG